MFIILICLGCDRSGEQPEIQNKVNHNDFFSLSVNQQILSEVERVRLSRKQKISDFIPTGIFIEPGQSLTVSVDVINGNQLPRALLGTYSRYNSSDQPKVFNLTADNKQTISNSSEENRMLYIKYAGANPDSMCEIEIIGGMRAPLFVIDQTEQSDFLYELENYSYSEVILRSAYADLLISKEVILEYKNQDWNLYLKSIDKIIDAEAYIDGLDNTEDVHDREGNRYFLTETKDSRYYMAATDYRTFYNEESAIHFLVDYESVHGSDGWGIWHELGHQHQISSLTWDEVVEVTVNIYSLAVERSLGIESRLKRNGHWEEIEPFFEKSLEERNFNQDLDYFPKLCMYQQLWLAFGDNFFIELHKQARKDAADLNSAQEKMSYFALLGSQIAETDLSDFFKKWGFNLPEDAYREIENLNLPKPEADLTLLRD